MSEFNRLTVVEQVYLIIITFRRCRIANQNYGLPTGGMHLESAALIIYKRKRKPPL